MDVSLKRHKLNSQLQEHEAATALPSTALPPIASPNLQASPEDQLRNAEKLPYVEFLHTSLQGSRHATVQQTLETSDHSKPPCTTVRQWGEKVHFGAKYFFSFGLQILPEGMENGCGYLPSELANSSRRECISNCPALTVLGCPSACPAGR